MSMETYHGQVKTPQDAILLFEACRLGLLPRVQRRLSEKERQQIRSGSVFVWDEREAGMRRWTDGKSWSASRVSGSFLTYREMEGKRGNGFSNAPSGRKSGSKSLDGSRNGDSDQDGGEDGPDGYRYKPDGLMKQSFSITTSDGRHLHLISYYSRQTSNQPLKQPTTDVSLRNIRPQKGMYPEATVNEASSIPAVTRGPMTGSPYSSAPPVGHPYPYPQGYMPGYPPGTWPSSPANTPPAHYAPYPYGYPVPGYPPAPYPPHLAPHYPPQPGPTQFDRAPPPPNQTNLPAPLHVANGHAPPPAPSYAPNSPPRVHTLPPYVQPAGAPSSLQPNPYSSSTIEARYEGAQQQQQQAPNPSYSVQAANGVPNGYHHNYQKPPTPPASSAGVTPNEKPLQADLVAAREVQNNSANGTATPTKMIPSINALINGDTQTNAANANGDKVGSRQGSRSPASSQPIATELPNAMAQSGYQKGQHDLKRLDTQMFKF